MSKIAIVYHYYAHYRTSIMSELAKSDVNEYYFIGGIETDINIKTIDFNQDDVLNKRFIKVENRWFNKKFLWQKGLISIVFDNQFDSYVFLGSVFHLSTWVATVIARLNSRKVYYWMHGFYKDSISLSDFIKIHLFYKLANEFFLYGNRSFERLNQLGIKKSSDMHIIYNSLDYEKSKSLRRILSNNDMRFFRETYFGNSDLQVVTFIGRLNFTKRIDLLINAQYILAIKNGFPIFNLLLIGEGEEMQALKELVDSYPIITNNVKFLGALYDEKLNAEILLHSDLCVTPGEVGLTAVHSLSYGTPVISHNNLNIQMPEVESIRIGVTGDLYEYGSVEDLARCIESWFHIHPHKSLQVMKECFSVIDHYYNPKFQLSVFDKTLK